VVNLKINKTQIIQVGRRFGVILTPDEAQDILNEVLPKANELHTNKASFNKVVDIITERLNKQREGRKNDLETKK